MELPLFRSVAEDGENYVRKILFVIFTRYCWDDEAKG
jgi:hypothetical protein